MCCCDVWVGWMRVVRRRVAVGLRDVDVDVVDVCGDDVEGFCECGGGYG